MYAVLAMFYATTQVDYANLFSGAQSEALGAISAILPLAVVVFAAILGVRIATRVFRTLTGR